MKIISHRGKIDTYRDSENDFMALKNFLESPVASLEIDIQLDPMTDRIVLLHDDLEDHTGLMDLEEALNIIGKDTEILLDIKNPRQDSEKFFKILFNILEGFDNVRLCSFYKNYFERVQMGIILDEENIDYFLETLPPHNFLSIDYKLLDKIKNFFGTTEIYVYTLNEYIPLPPDITGLITDFPEYFLVKYEKI